MANNNTANVSLTKFVQGGYFFSAPSGTEPPNDFSTPLGDAFVNVGFVSEDGVEEDINDSTETYKDANGDVICVGSSEREETIKLKLVEIKKDSLAEIYGHDNVTDASGMITAKHKFGGRGERVYVLELLLKDGRKWRQVIHKGTVTEVGTLSLASTELAGREITIFAATNDEGVSVTDYIQSTESN